MIDESICKLHRWTKEEDPTRGMAVPWDEDTKTFRSDPKEVLDCRSKSWSDIWKCRGSGARTRTVRAVRKARPTPLVAQEPGSLDITGKDIQNAGAFRKRTST